MTDIGATSPPRRVDGGDGEQVLAAGLTAMRERARSRNLERVEVVAKAVEALAQGRLEENERAQAEQAAHSLAGSAGTFGFHEVTEPARDLEQLLGGDPTVAGEPTARARSSLAALREALTAADDIPAQKDRS